MSAIAMCVLLLCAFVNACLAAATPASVTQRDMAVVLSYALSAIGAAAGIVFAAG